MKIWQADLYKLPTIDRSKQILWELLICEGESVCYESQCPQSQVNSDWLIEQIQIAAKGQLPDRIQVFRPQCFGLLNVAAQKMGITVEATRRTRSLKQELKKRADRLANNLLQIEQLPPQSVPEHIWGEEWRFAAIVAGDLIEIFRDRPIPVVDMPEFLDPIELAIASDILVPGVVIYGGRQSMQLVRWLEKEKPVSLNFIANEPGKSGGLVLESGLIDRWILATFEQPEIAQAAATYEQRKLDTKGLHFLLVQPDDSGMTFSGFWLLQPE